MQWSTKSALQRSFLVAGVKTPPTKSFCLLRDQDLGLTPQTKPLYQQDFRLKPQTSNSWVSLYVLATFVFFWLSELCSQLQKPNAMLVCQALPILSSPWYLSLLPSQPICPPCSEAPWYCHNSLCEPSTLSSSQAHCWETDLLQMYTKSIKQSQEVIPNSPHNWRKFHLYYLLFCMF